MINLAYLHQWLGKDVCKLLFTWNKVEFHSAIHHMFPDEMVSDVYVLGPGMMYWILCDCNCTCIVTEYWNIFKLKSIIN